MHELLSPHYLTGTKTMTTNNIHTLIVTAMEQSNTSDLKALSSLSRISIGKLVDIMTGANTSLVDITGALSSMGFTMRWADLSNLKLCL